MKTLLVVLLAPIWVPCYLFVYGFSYAVIFLAAFGEWMTTDITWKRAWRVNSI